MSIKNKDLHETATDAVRSQISAAIEDGVTGFGDKPDTTTILEKDYAFKVNSLDNYGSQGSGKSSTINRNVVNKIASIQIEKEEIPKIIDKLEASFVEDAIDAAIILKIVEKIKEGEGSPNTGIASDPGTIFTRFNNNREDQIAQLKQAEGVIDTAASIYHMIQVYESTLAKGNLIKNVKGTFLSLKGLGDFAANFRQLSSLDPYVINQEEGVSTLPVDAGFAGPFTTPEMTNKFLTPDIFFKIARCLEGENSEVIKSKTVSALVIQMLALAEDAVDYGISERFFRRVFKGLYTSTEYAGGYDLDKVGSAAGFMATPGSYFYEIPRCIPPARVQIFENQDPKFQPRKLCDMFGIGTKQFIDGLEHEESSAISITTGPRSLPQDFSSNFRNPFSCIPGFVNILDVRNKIIYFSSVISRELIISRGISEASSLNDAALNSFLGDSNPQSNPISNQLYGVNSVPLSRATFGGKGPAAKNLYIPFGFRAFGSSAQSAAVGMPAYDRIGHDISRSKLHKLVQDQSPGGASRGFMPLEVLDPADFENAPYVGIFGTNDTLKSLVTNAIFNDPQNVETPLNMHLDYLLKLRDTLEESNQVLNRTNNVRGSHTMLSDPSITMKIAMRVISDLGIMAAHAAKLQTKGFDSDGSTADAKKVAMGREALCSLVALTTFFKPGTAANSKQKDLKSEFVRRACMLDIATSAQLDNQTIMDVFDQGGIDGTNLGFHVVKFTHASPHFMADNDLGYAADFAHAFNEMRFSLRAAGFATETGIDRYETNYFRYLDHVHPSKYFYGDMTASFVDPEMMTAFEENVIRLTNNLKLSGVQKNKKTEALVGELSTGTDFGEDSIKNDQYMAIFAENTLYAGSGLADNFSLEKFGATGLFYGYDFINYVFGPSLEGDVDANNGASSLNFNFETGSSLLKMVIDTADYIQEFLKAQDSNNIVRHGASNGVTVANGMDKHQLVAFIFEMYSILANDFFESCFTLSPYSTMVESALIHNHSRNLAFTAFQSQTLPSSYNKKSRFFKHLVSVVPKISGLNPNPNTQKSNQSIMAGVQQPVVELLEFATYLQYLGRVDTWKDETFKLLRPEFFEAAFNSINFSLSNNFKDNPTFAEEFKAKMEIKEGQDFKLGQTLSFRDLIEVYRECGEEASFPAIAGSGATDILAYMSIMYANNLSLVSGASVEGLPQKIYDVLTSHNLDKDIFIDFIKNGNINQVAYARYKLSNALKSLGETYTNLDGKNYHDHEVFNTGIPVDQRRGPVIDAVKLYLDFILNEEKDFVEFTFFGVSNRLHRDEIIKAIAKDADLTSNDSKSIVYDFSFLKNSELSDDVQFIPKNAASEGFTRDLSVFTTIKQIGRNQGVLDGTPPTSFFDLINKTKFYRLNYQDYDYTFKSMTIATGLELIQEAEKEGKEEQVTNILINTVSSILMGYIFERLTGFPVNAENITSHKEKTISGVIMKNFLEAATKLDTPVSAPSGVQAVMDALFVPSESSSVTQPVRLTSDEDAIKKALEPRLVKNPQNPLEMKFLDPIVSEDMFMVIQALLKTNFVSGRSIDEAVLSTTTFDAVFGIETSGLKEETSYDTVPSESDLAGIPALLDLLNQMKDGDIQLNNYKAVLRRAVQKSETPGS